MIRALRLRDADTEAPIPTIALTGTTRPEDRIRMLASGFQVHVPKPEPQLAPTVTVTPHIDVHVPEQPRPRSIRVVEDEDGTRRFVPE